MRTVWCAALMLIGGAALAQPTEHVTVTGTRSHEVIEHFVQSFAAPARMTGKMARWETGICPKVMGLPAGFAGFIATRLTTIAKQVGAPVGAAGCEPNIQIVFTSRPQALLDDVRAHAPELLGYLDNADQRAAAAVVRRPVQAWYMTETVDLRGARHVDDAVHGGGLMLTISPKLPPIFIPHAQALAVTGTRLGDGLRSAFHHVLIVADPKKLTELEMGALADHIAMLALSQPASLQDCQPLTSVLDLLNGACDHAAALTDTDRTFLEGLYRMNPEANLRSQEDQVAYRMEHGLAGP